MLPLQSTVSHFASSEGCMWLWLLSEKWGQLVMVLDDEDEEAWRDLVSLDFFISASRPPPPLSGTSEEENVGCADDKYFSIAYLETNKKKENETNTKVGREATVTECIIERMKR